MYAAIIATAISMGAPATAISGPFPATASRTGVRASHALAAESADSAPGTRVARKNRRGHKAARPPAELVRVHAQLKEVRWKHGRRTFNLYWIPAGTAVPMDVQGKGSLVFFFHRVLPSQAGPAKLTLTVDSNPPQALAVNGGKREKGRQVAGPKVSLANKKRVAVTLKAGDHRVLLSPSNQDIAVRVEFVPAGKRKPAPLVFVSPEVLEPAPAVAAIPPVETDPADPDLPAAPLETFAMETPAMETVDAAIVDDSGMSMVEKQVRAGELRHGRTKQLNPIHLRHRTSGATQELFQVSAQESYEVVAGGPGTLTVRFHPLVSSEAGESYGVAVMENDAVLHRLQGTSQVDSDWIVASGTPLAANLGQAREIRLKLGDYVSRFALQISSGAGMVVGHDFAAEELSLADIGLADATDAANTPSTSVTEVELQEMVVEKIVYRGGADSFALSMRGGGALPVAGGKPSFGGGVEFDYILPFAGRRLSLGLGGTFEWHEMTTQAWDARGTAVPSRVVVMVVPVCGRAVVRQVWSDRFSVYGSLMAGAMYLGVQSHSLGAQKQASDWQPFGEAGGGSEVKLGIGWLGLQSTYRFVEPTSLDDLITGYSAGGVTLSLHYRVGL